MTDFHFDEIIDVLKFDNQVVYDKVEKTKRNSKVEEGFHDNVSVSRVVAKGEDDDCYLELDVHTELYPMLPGQKFRMLISATLNMDGSAVTAYFPEGKQKSLADKFEYVMHGLLYKMAEVKDKTSDGDDEVKVVVNISFGGLQLMLKGDPLKMRRFKSDQKLFLLLRKI